MLYVLHGIPHDFRLWERILADNAKAEFIVAGIGKPREGGASYYLMQFSRLSILRLTSRF